VYQTSISARLDEVVLEGDAKPANRTSELEPLSQDFDQLRSLIAAAKQDHTTSARVEEARIEAYKNSGIPRVIL
jgi:hypothetical protein